MAAIQKRVGRSGKTSWRVQIRKRGYPATTRSFHTKTAAEKWARHTETEIELGRYGVSNESNRHTLAELIDDYVANAANGKTPKQEMANRLGWWHEQLGARKLSEITPAVLSAHKRVLRRGKTNRGETRKPATVNRHLAYLSSCLSYGMRELQWIAVNPMAQVSKYPEPAGRIRFLSDTERQNLLNACKHSPNEFLYSVVVLALSTGARKGEIMGLRWKNIDFSRSQATLTDTKNGEIRVLPLTGLAMELVRDLSKIRRIDTDLVFPNREGSKSARISPAWKRALSESGVEDFRFHDLRHSAASYLAMNGASPSEIAAVLGHKTLQMVKRYAHVSENHTHSVVERMNNEIFGDIK